MDQVTFMDVIQWCTSHIVELLLFLSVFVEIIPIKVNPVTAILNLLFKPIRKDMNDMKTELNNNINSVKVELKQEIDQIKNEQSRQSETIKQLIETSEMDEISRIRWEIIEFSRSIDNGHLHTRDEYHHIKDDNRRYHFLIEKNKLTNGIIDEEVDKINKHYEENKDSTSVYF